MLIIEFFSVKNKHSLDAISYMQELIDINCENRHDTDDEELPDENPEED